MTYFKCDPSLCYGASCCKNRTTKPVLGISDLVRLSRHTKRTLIDTWNEHGDVVLVPIDHVGLFAVHHGLKIPCPYLENNRCSAYQVRPFGCATFPLSSIQNDPEDLKLYDPEEFRCLRGVTLSSKQADTLRKIEYIMEKEANLDVSALNGTLIEMDARTSRNIGLFIRDAAVRQGGIDPGLRTNTSTRFISSSQKLLTMLRTGQPIPADDFKELLEPTASIIFRDKLTEMLKEITPEVIARYERTSERYLELLRELTAANT
jgi:Fe-S-cluster containining protein